ncbi:MAG: riboflavin biosynthesis protein RibF [Zetaproteobacteria bacterium]|nr:MAG: riboflavin biosynthesis protein RibF [Zetaproteobacteria bacterium]RPI11686.1 MAG: riboflavin biosynthesis protein RibF [Zetaproteobacteria bacterium]
MQVIHATTVEDLRCDLPEAVLGLGTLDGVHLGHQAILRRVAERAAAGGGTPAALTFAQHPLEVVRPEQAPALITPLPLKLALLERLGMTAVVVIHFTPALATLEADDFVRRGLVDGLRVRGLCVGYDFGFGRGRRGNVELLDELSRQYGFWLEVTPPVTVDGQAVSSRAIRALLLQGRVAEAHRLLGRPYCLAGEVARGEGRGRTLGFATANLPLPNVALLKDGVYAGRVLVRGVFRDAMMNLGSAPTFGGGVRRLEIHLPGWDEALYGERIVAFLVARLRDEQRFPDAAALRAQLGRDREAAEAVWRGAEGFPWPEWALHS